MKPFTHCVDANGKVIPVERVNGPGSRGWSTYRILGEHKSTSVWPAGERWSFLENGLAPSPSFHRLRLIRIEDETEQGQQSCDLKETTTMAKATFTSTDTFRKPTHWRNKETGSVTWMAGNYWNRICTDGRVEDRNRISVNPVNSPELFEPLYGDLVITISAQG